MARIMREAHALVAPGVVQTILTPPSGKKFEVLNVGCADFFTLGSAWVLVSTAPGHVYYPLDQLDLAAGKYAIGKNMGSILIPHGMTFDVLMLVTGTPAASIYVSYMDVDL